MSQEETPVEERRALNELNRGLLRVGSSVFRVRRTVQLSPSFSIRIFIKICSILSSHRECPLWPCRLSRGARRGARGGVRGDLSPSQHELFPWIFLRWVAQLEP